VRAGVRGRAGRARRLVAATKSEMSLPEFGKGSHAQRLSRRLALGIGAFVVALIAGLVIYAIVSQGRAGASEGQTRPYAA
jgi:hypothetical protein